MQQFQNYYYCLDQKQLIKKPRHISKQQKWKKYYKDHYDKDKIENRNDEYFIPKRKQILYDYNVDGAMYEPSSPTEDEDDNHDDDNYNDDDNGEEDDIYETENKIKPQTKKSKIIKVIQKPNQKPKIKKTDKKGIMKSIKM